MRWRDCERNTTVLQSTWSVWITVQWGMSATQPFKDETRAVCCSTLLMNSDAAAFNHAWLCCCNCQCHLSHCPSLFCATSWGGAGGYQVNMRQGAEPDLQPLVIYTAMRLKCSLSSRHVCKGAVQQGDKMWYETRLKISIIMTYAKFFKLIIRTLWESAKSVHMSWIWAV